MDAYRHPTYTNRAIKSPSLNHYTGCWSLSSDTTHRKCLSKQHTSKQLLLLLSMKNPRDPWAPAATSRHLMPKQSPAARLLLSLPSPILVAPCSAVFSCHWHTMLPIGDRHGTWQPSVCRGVSGSAGECWTYFTLNNAEYVYLHG